MATTTRTDRDKASRSTKRLPLAGGTADGPAVSDEPTLLARAQAAEEAETSRLLTDAVRRREAEHEQARAAEAAQAADDAAQVARDRAEKARRAEAEAAQAEGRPERTPREVMLVLREDCRQAGREFMAGVEQAELFEPDVTPEERRVRLEGLHQVYAQKMIMGCVKPLKAGINKQSIIQAVGTATALWMLAPDFKAQIGKYREDMRTALDQRLDSQAHAQLERAGGDASKLKPKWRQRIETIAAKEKAEIERVDRTILDQRAEPRGGVPFTAQSAGMALLGLGENVRAEMLKPGADIDGLQRTHAAAVETLYADAERDGVEKAEVATAARQVLCQRLETEPELASTFATLAHAFHEPLRHESAQPGAEGRTQRVRRWDFMDDNGWPVKDELFFDPRPPESAKQHRERTELRIARALDASARAGDLEKFNADLKGFMMGYAAHESPDEAGSAGETADKSAAPTPALAVPAEMAGAVARSGVMLRSMAADGLNAKERQEIYSNAYLNAIEMVDKRFPSLSAEWESKYGDWRTYMREAVVDPQVAMETWSHTERLGSDQAQPAAAEPEPQPAEPHPEPASVSDTLVDLTSDTEQAVALEMGPSL